MVRWSEVIKGALVYIFYLLCSLLQSSIFHLPYYLRFRSTRALVVRFALSAVLYGTSETAGEGGRYNFLSPGFLQAEAELLPKGRYWYDNISTL
jgi:hypothetical protein